MGRHETQRSHAEERRNEKKRVHLKGMRSLPHHEQCRTLRLQRHPAFLDFLQWLHVAEICHAGFMWQDLPHDLSAAFGGTRPWAASPKVVAIPWHYVFPRIATCQPPSASLTSSRLSVPSQYHAACSAVAVAFCAEGMLWERGCSSSEEGMMF